MARRVWLLMRLQMYRPPPLNRSILKLFCQLEIYARVRDAINLYWDVLGGLSRSLHSYAVCNVIGDTARAILLLAPAHGPLPPPVHIYTMPLYFLYFFTNIGFVNLFLDNKQYSLYA